MIKLKYLFTITALTFATSLSFATTPGDVNADGLANEADYLLISEAIETSTLFGLTDPLASDLNGDSALSIADKRIFEEYLAGRLVQPQYTGVLGDVTGDLVVDSQDAAIIADALNTTPVLCNRACERVKVVCQRLQDQGKTEAAEKVCAQVEEKWGAETTQLSNIQMIFADIDGNGELSSNDLNLVQGLIDGTLKSADLIQANSGTFIVIRK